MQFVNPESSEGKEIRTVLAKTKIADELYPHKPGKVSKLVEKKSRKKFSTNDHVYAWKYFEVRPKNGSEYPGKTNKEYCIFHAAHGDYTYSDAWIEFLTIKVKTEDFIAEIKKNN